MNKNIPVGVIILVIAVLLLQSIFLFWDSRKRNYNYWLWGIIGLIQFPMPALIYLLFVRKIFGTNNLKNGN